MKRSLKQTLRRLLCTDGSKCSSARSTKRSSGGSSKPEALARPVPTRPNHIPTRGASTINEKNFRNGKHLSFCRESAVRARRERASGYLPTFGGGS